MPSLSERTLLEPTLASGAEAAGDAANYSFAQRVRRCYVSNGGDAAIKVKVNTNASPEASATEYDFIVPINTTVDVSDEGAISISTVSVFFAAASTVNVELSGLV